MILSIQSNHNNEQFFAGVSYTMDNLYLGALFVDAHRYDSELSGRNNPNLLSLAGEKVHQRGYEYAAAYTMGKTVFTATYNYLAGIHEAKGLTFANQAGVDATYYFNSNFRTYVGYTAFLNGTHALRDHNQFALGARYDF